MATAADVYVFKLKNDRWCWKHRDRAGHNLKQANTGFDTITEALALAWEQARMLEVPVRVEHDGRVGRGKANQPQAPSDMLSPAGP